jgi:acid phosphatase/acid phosphatase (class A)
MRRFFHPLALLLLLAAGRTCPAANDHPLFWLSPAAAQALVDSVPAPPAAGSPEDLADVAAVEQAEKARTPARIAEAKQDATFSAALFRVVVGPKFDAAHDPKLYALLENVRLDAKTISRTAKMKWKRLRPFRAHPEIHALLSESDFSYPSGHATGAYALAVILAGIYPDKKAELMQRAAAIAQSRVDAGVHYPSDIVEGQKLGRAIDQALLANPDFAQSLAAAKPEAVTP